jgi:triacylglycerol lipase
MISNAKFMGKISIKTCVLSLIIIVSASTGMIGNIASLTEDDPDHNPILFLHGWTKTKDDWISMRQWFQADGWPQTMLFAYDSERIRSSCSAQAHIDYATEIADWVDDILNQTVASKVDLVGHSSGGLSGRYYVKNLGGIDKVDHFVALASTNHGTLWSGGAQCFSAPNNLGLFLIELNEGDETPGGILEDRIGDRIDSTLETTYNGTHIPGNVSYTSIYSLDDTLISPRTSPILEGAFNIEISGVGHSMYSTDFVYDLVKAAVNDEIMASTTAFITVREVLILVGTLVILRQITRKNKG